MTSPHASASDKVWQTIDAEKRRDRLIKRIGIAGWSVTLALVIVLLVLEGMSVAQMAGAAMRGNLPWMSVLGTALPGIVVLGVLAVLVASLATVAMFFRLRAATLDEIQLRLAALEDLMVSSARSPT